ncbi:MAG: hypothetical protein KF855_11070 [Acidobacteria bacterium]|nr:hypothetical protein [Acidobacteriota bacterium]
MPYAFLITILLVSLLAACGGVPRPAKHSDAPKKMLWAWERPEDLTAFDPKEYGVAFLAQTLTLERDDLNFRPRRQPLKLADGAYIVAVTRIETMKRTEQRPSYSDEQIERIVRFVKDSLNRPNVKGVQIDFDVVVSERAFYRKLMKEIRSALPKGTPLTMTALASWCLGDRWLQEMDVDEAVPMAFVMGADTDRIRAFLNSGNDWPEPLCRESYGFSIDEPAINAADKNRRIYYFKNSAWDVESISSF